MSRHVVLARRDAGTPHLWTRNDWDGQRWTTADLIYEHGNRASSVQSNLSALVAGVVADLGSADFTLSARSMPDIIARGDPRALDVPLASSVVVLLPIGRENAAHESELWTQALIAPSSREPVQILGPDRRFVRKRLLVELRSILTPADLAERAKLHDRRELWIRHGISAAELAPDAVPAFVPKPPDPAIEEERMAKLARQARNARVKAASHKSAEAAKADRAAGERFARDQAAKRAKAAAKSQK